MMAFNRLVTALFCVFVVLPLLWLLYAAFLPPEAMLSAQLVPTGFSLGNFADLRGTGVGRALLVSLVASGLTVSGQLIFGLMAAYAIRTGLPLLGLVLLALALPSELLLIPLYRELRSFGLLDTLAALVLPFLGSPLVIFLLLQALRRLPWELVEAARLDGAGEVTVVARVLAPLLRPELLAAGVLAFAAHWNLVLYPRVVASALPTVQVFLSDLLRSRPLEWGLLGAAALVTSLPILILYLVFEGRIIRVFEASFQ
jgi:multiple sugar transport system permease protein